MASRKKRLKKGIESLKKQIELHEEKKKKAEVEGNIELVDYYEKEIESKRRDKEEKERMLEKGGQMKRTKVLVETKKEFLRKLDKELKEIEKGKKKTFDEDTISFQSVNKGCKKKDNS